MQNGLAAIPAGLTGYEKERPDETGVDAGQCVLLDIPDLQLHLRLHDHFMGALRYL